LEKPMMMMMMMMMLCPFWCLQTHSAILDVLENRHVKAASASNGGGCNTAHGNGELHGPSVDPQIGFRQVRMNALCSMCSSFA
jgi:hypothetical protein